MKVVFDTNIFISALILPGGKADEAIMRIIDGADTLHISRDIIDEVLTVLARKIGKDPEALSEVAVKLAEIGLLVSPAEKMNVFDDESDNRILECAMAGGAEAIVTGDKAMLMFKKHQNIKIISLNEFLRREGK
jgi:putative PIN family toxin of toxin-antitoxin system